MHFYRYNIGDYRKDTGHLSLVEHGIYRALLDTYYSEEQPLCADDAKLMRTHGIRTADEQEAYKNVINDFFFKTERGYEHDRCNTELGLIYEKSDKARISAEKRWEREKQKNTMKSEEENAESMRTHSERSANEQKDDAFSMLPSNPLPSNPLPSNKKKESAKPRFDPLKMELPENLSFDSWQAWVAYRASCKFKSGEATLQTQLAFLAKQGNEAGAVIEQTIRNGWQGLFELKNKQAPMQNNRPSYDDGQKRDYGTEIGLL